MTSFFRAAATAFALSLAAITPAAWAQTAVPVDGSWRPFNWNVTSVVGNPFTFTCGAPGCQLDIVDAFLCGDQFSVAEGATLLGLTSAPACPVAASASNGSTAWTTAGYSKGSFWFAPGAHSITLGVPVNPSPPGTGYLRVIDAVAPTAVPTLGGWALGLLSLFLAAAAAVRRRRD